MKTMFGCALLTLSLSMLVGCCLTGKKYRPSDKIIPVEIQGRIETQQFSVNFAFNSSTLTEELPIVLPLEPLPIKVTVYGHADLQGGYAYNDNLSFRRALSVKADLVRVGVPEHVIQVVAMGKNAPVCRQPLRSCHARNRRVVVYLAQEVMHAHD